MPDDILIFARRVFVGFLAVLAIGAGGGFLIGRYLFPAQPALEAPGTTIAQAEAELVQAQARTDTLRDTVRIRIDRLQRDTLWRRDTLTVRDTLRVLVPAPTLAAIDSTVRACSALASSCAEERAAAQRVIGAYRDSVRALRPRFRDRFGIYFGYGGSASPGGTITHGAQLGAGVRVWP